MKRTTKSLIAFLVLIAMCVSFCVPTFAEVTEGEHTTGETVTEETVTPDNGTDSEICPGADKIHTKTNCTFTESEKDRVEAECGVDGYKIGVCDTCGKRFAYDVEKAPTDHTWVETERVEATCVADGYYIEECSNENCDAEPKRYVLAKEDAAHKLGEAYFEGDPCSPTGAAQWKDCTEDGCDYREEVDGSYKQYDNHNWVILEGNDENGDPYEVLPGCCIEGKTTFECSYCGRTKVVIIKPTFEEHNFASADAWANGATETLKDIVKPTHTEKGSAKVKCTNAGCNEWNSVEIHPTGHDAVLTDKEGKAATCTEPGYTAYKECSCGYIEGKVVIDALGHDKTVTTIDGTCTTTEKTVTTCSRCDLNETVETDLNGDDVIDEKDYVHTYGATYDEYRAATCTKLGYEFYHCSKCGATKTITLPLAPHDFENGTKVVDVEGNCTVDEVWHYVCAVDGCGAESEPETKAATGHVMADPVVVHATCVAKGSTTTSCKNCDEVTETVETDSIDPNYHATGENGAGLFSIVTEATCTTPGLKTQYCPACNMVPVDVVINAYNHVDPVTGESTIAKKDEVAADCGSAASWVEYCTMCDYESDTITGEDKLGHGTEGWEEISSTPATCTEAKKVTYRCIKCGTYEKTETEGTALGHDWADPTKEADAAYVQIKLPTCQDTRGGYFVECKRCTVESAFRDYSSIDSKFVYNPNNPAHHIDSEKDLSVGVDGVFRRPTCAANGQGYYQYLCASVEDGGCGATFRVTMDDDWGKCEYFKDTENTLGLYEYVSAQEPTCTVDGRTEGYVCLSCKTIYESEVVEKTNHPEATRKYDEKIDPTCTATGTEAGWTCMVEGCGHREGYGEIAALGHAAVTDAAVAATCTETGLTEGSHCSRCNTILVAQTVVDALGHDEEVIPGKVATCVSAGLTDGKYCKRCETTTVEQTELPKLDHTYNEASYKEVVAPTCTTKGYTIYFCSTCTEDDIAAAGLSMGDRQYIRDYKDALGHEEVEISAITATCVVEGFTAGVKCSREGCGAILTAPTSLGKRVDAEGNPIHVDENGDPINVACKPGEAGVTNMVCADCEQEVERNHSARAESVVSATCTSEGYSINWCEDCGWQLIVPGSVKPAMGHDFSVYTVTADPQVGVPGTYVYYCSRCDVFESKPEYTIPALEGIEFVYGIENINGGKVVANSNTIKLVISTSATNVDLYNVILNVKYNTEILEFVGYEFVNSEKFEDYSITPVKKANGSVVIAAYAVKLDAVSQPTPVNTTLNGEEEFAVLTFKVGNDTAGESVAFDIVTETEDASETISSAADENGEVVVVDFGAVTPVEIKQLGKLSGSDGLSASDAVVIVNISTQKDESGAKVYDATADVNQDGIVDLYDYAWLQQFLTGAITADEFYAGEYATETVE